MTLKYFKTIASKWLLHSLIKSIQQYTVWLQVTPNDPFNTFKNLPANSNYTHQVSSPDDLGWPWKYLCFKMVTIQWWQGGICPPPQTIVLTPNFEWNKEKMWIFLYKVVKLMTFWGSRVSPPRKNVLPPNKFWCWQWHCHWQYIYPSSFEQAIVRYLMISDDLKNTFKNLLWNGAYTLSKKKVSGHFYKSNFSRNVSY